MVNPCPFCGHERGYSYVPMYPLVAAAARIEAYAFTLGYMAHADTR